MSCVARARSGLQWRCVQVHSVDKASGVRADHTIALRDERCRHHSPNLLRRVRYVDTTTCRCSLKRLKQHLSIDHLFGNSANAVKTPIRIAICANRVALMIRKQPTLDVQQYALMHLLEVNLFEMVSVKQMVRLADAA